MNIFFFNEMAEKHEGLNVVKAPMPIFDGTEEGYRAWRIKSG